MSFIVAITGPTGSGKSTVAIKIAKKINKCVNIDADVVKHFIDNGFIYDQSPQGIAQWELLGTNIGQLAKNFHDSGYNVVINGYIDEPSWEKLKSYVKLDRKFLILPKVETTIERDQGRSVEAAMGADAVKTHTNYFATNAYYSDYIRIDSSNQSVDQTVDVILNKLKESGFINA
jgi:adenylylsulfate kinase-like enzyme